MSKQEETIEVCRSSDCSVAEVRVKPPTEPGLYWAQGVTKHAGDRWERLDVIRISGDPPFVMVETVPTSMFDGRIVNRDLIKGVSYWNKFTKIDPPTPLPNCRGRTSGI